MSHRNEFITSFTADPGSVPIPPGKEEAGALRVHTLGTFNVKSYGAKGNGVDDETDAIQRAIDAAIAAGGGIVILPFGRYTVRAILPTIANPRRILIRNAVNVHVIGYGAVVSMEGIDKAYLDSIDDHNSSARDVFTAFSFVLSSRCSIRGIRFEGTWDGTGTFRYQSPRAKAVGFIGTTDCYAADLDGYGILGNVVNGTPADAAYEGETRTLSGLAIENCRADLCLENGFNTLGNTKDVRIIACVGTRCGTTGAESAADGLVIQGNRFNGNKVAGMSVSGTNAAVTGNVCTANGSGADGIQGAGAIVSGGHDVQFAGNVFAQNTGFGIQIYPGIYGISIAGNRFIDNAQTGAPNQAAINMVGAVGNLIAEISITGNVCVDSGVGGITTTFVNASYATKIHIHGNRVSLQTGGTAAVVIQNTCTFCVVAGNSANKGYSLSAGTGIAYLNERDGDTLAALDAYGGTLAFLEWNGNSGTGTAPAVSTWKTGAALQGYLKIKVNGVQAWLPYYNDPTGP